MTCLSIPETYFDFRAKIEPSADQLSISEIATQSAKGNVRTTMAEKFSL
jgi:hypothetical protein